MTTGPLAACEIFEQLIAESVRVRDEVMPGFLALGRAGDNAVRNMRRQLDGAMRALLQRDRDRAATLLAALRAQRSFVGKPAAGGGT